MEYSYLKVERADGILVLTLHDPATRNALGQGMASELLDALDAYERNPNDRMLVITGTDPSFCSGGNVKEMEYSVQDMKDSGIGEEREQPWGKMEARLRLKGGKGLGLAAQVPFHIHQLQKPSLAAVNGHAMGVGMGLAISCDIRIASEQAVFAEAFVRLGLIPGDGSCWMLPRLIGTSNTLLMQYTGQSIDVDEAYRIGLVSRVTPHAELMPSAMELATQVTRNPTQAVSLIKYLVHKSTETNVKESLEIAHAAQEVARSTEDHKEAVQAFLEKRSPQFTGR